MQLPYQHTKDKIHKSMQEQGREGGGGTLPMVGKAKSYFSTSHKATEEENQVE